MEKREINPWEWQFDRSYVQAVEVKNVESTLYVSGQAAIYPDGTSSNEDMKSQITLALNNLEQVITEAGYEAKNIARLTIYTTAPAEVWEHFSIFADWVAKNGVKAAVSMMEVVSLYETLKVEFEATAVK
ncbi:RidA family protein [Flavobacterium zepuense]|uniref:RidA family protein n=1 Tax=Flavobacterium zepuense TaxID=2593302 RepID=A0A552V8A3_9FLAO|nr:RidA family protein [Flavobacterium zepuense]TRW26680.1 RidA family protein [Flavobacterium zepuense]